MLTTEIVSVVNEPRAMNFVERVYIVPPLPLALALAVLGDNKGFEVYIPLPGFTFTVVDEFL